MSTRYVWEKRTYSGAYLSSAVNARGFGVSVYSAYDSTYSTMTITLCSSYTVGLDSNGKPNIIPSGSKTVIYSNGSGSNGSWPTDTYQYAVVTHPVSSMAQPYIYSSISSGQHWMIANEQGFGRVFSLSKSSSTPDRSGDATVADMYVDRSSTSLVTSSNSDLYSQSAGEFVNSERAAFYYQGSDNIDPATISYTTKANVGDSVTLTIAKSNSIVYDSIITYVIEKKQGGGSWGQFSSITSLSTYYYASSAGTVQFRVHAKDNYGFESTTYATGSTLTIVGSYLVSLIASPSNGGTVSGGGTYSGGSSVTVTASPNSGYTFSHWLEGGSQVSAIASYKFTINSNRILTAVFNASTTYYTVSVSASPSNGGTVFGGGSYANGTSATVRAVANSGYNFNGWYESGAIKSSSTSYTFSVTSNKTLTAQFSTQSSGGTGANHKAIIGIGDIAHNVSNIYIGVDGKARQVKKGYIGIDAKARLFYEQYDPNKFIELGTWSAQTVQTSDWGDVCYGGGQFVVAGTGVSTVSSSFNGVMYSNDAVNWKYTPITFPNTTFSKNFTKVAYGNGVYVITPETSSYATKTIYSTDLINWYTADLPSASAISALAYGYGRFVGLKYNSNTFFYSADGTGWYSGSLPYSATWCNMIYAQNKFVAVHTGSTNSSVIYSTNGTTWNTANLPISDGLNDIAYGNGIFVAISNRNSFISVDGISWTSYALPESTGNTATWSNIVFGGGKFLIHKSGSAKSDEAAYSVDGINWNTFSLPSSLIWNKMAYGNGKFVVIDTWNSGVSNSGKTVAYANG